MKGAYGPWLTAMHVGWLFATLEGAMWRRPCGYGPTCNLRLHGDGGALIKPRCCHRRLWRMNTGSRRLRLSLGHGCHIHRRRPLPALAGRGHGHSRRAPESRPQYGPRDDRRSVPSGTRTERTWLGKKCSSLRWAGQDNAPHSDACRSVHPGQTPTWPMACCKVGRSS